MTGTTKLAVYNGALRILGDPPLVATTDDVASRYALDAAWDRMLDDMLRQGAWRFAVKAATQTLTADAASVPGYTFTKTMPADWVYTHSLFLLRDFTREIPLDIREEGGRWAARVATVVARYVSTDYYDPTKWTSAFEQAFTAALAKDVAYTLTGGMQNVQMADEEFKRTLNFALQVDAIPRNPWLRFQLSGQFIHSVRFVMEHGGWRFARKTVTLTGAGTALPGTGYRYPLPADWVRTLQVQATGVGMMPAISSGDYYSAIPFQEESGGAIYTDTANATITYLSTDGYDASLWPESFSEAVLRHCQLTDGNMSAKDLQAFAAELREAEFRDNYRDRARVNQVGQVVRARLGAWSGYYPDHSGAADPPLP